MLKFIPSKCSKLTEKQSDFFTMVEENFEIQSFQMLQIDTKTQVISSLWLKKIFNSVLPKRSKLTDFFTMVEENFEIQSFQMLQIDWKM